MELGMVQIPDGMRVQDWEHQEEMRFISWFERDMFTRNQIMVSEQEQVLHIHVSLEDKDCLL
jgi:hypothetical protein